ncbi:hypothetical protein FB45DRAFT_1057034 [Roridomyces roridus]|uniref:C2 domain-containing protein n=1 Tax=Roridomyces roridus TaxID=1738132 RepID=A0AAD7C020_9AGAR|nr:hypothetical protein FB45DRAFT_1057034 [Roridomyces roridus]
MSTTDTNETGTRGLLDVTVVRCVDLTVEHRNNFWVEVKVDEVSKKTKKADKNSPWNESHSFATTSTSNLRISVYEKRYAHKPMKGFIGQNALASVGDDSRITFTLGGGELPRRANLPVPRIELALKLQDSPDNTEMAIIVRLAKRATALYQQPALADQITDVANLASTADSVVQNALSVQDTWEPLLEKINIVVRIADDVAEIHPYAKVAYSVMVAAYKVIAAQIERDQSVQSLALTMYDVYEFICEAEPLKQIESHKRIIAQLVQQTTDCGYFITDYFQDLFGTRLAKHILSGTDAAITQYQNKFVELKKALLERAGIHTEILVLRVLKEVHELAVDLDLTTMPYANGARFESGKQCLQGTCNSIQTRITNWIENYNAPNSTRFLVVCGPPGSGKSTILHTICHQYNDRQRLGSSFFYDRSCHSIREVFPTIAYDLASREPQIKFALGNIIKNDRGLRANYETMLHYKPVAQDYSVQYFRGKTMALHQPAQELALSGPILIVIDGLNQCEDTDTRWKLLCILAETAHELPRNFRIIITGCTQQQDFKPFTQGFAAEQLIVHSSSADDILAYIQTTLTDRDGKPLPGVDAIACKVLVGTAAGSFDTVASTCHHIKGPGAGTPGAEARLMEVIKSSLPALLDHDDLFYDLLSKSFPADDATLIRQFKSVMGDILTAREHLPNNLLRQLRKYRDSDEPFMGPDILDVILRSDCDKDIWKDHTQRFLLALPLRPSLASFLLDSSRSRGLSVDKTTAEEAMAMSCLRTLNSELKFDICHFPSSHLRNGDVEDLGSHISEFISPQLAYACRFFVEHIQCVPFEGVLSVELETLLGSKFLLWMEAASLLQLIDQMVPMLTVLEHWIEPEDNKNLKALIAEARKFVITFGGMASESTPHVYISALAMAPPGSFILIWDVPPGLTHSKDGQLIASFCEDTNSEDKHSGWFLGPNKELLCTFPNPGLPFGPAWIDFRRRYIAIQHYMPVNLRRGETDIREVALCLVRMLKQQMALVAVILDLAEYWLVTSVEKTRSVDVAADGFNMYIDPFVTLNIQGSEPVAPVRRFKFDLLFIRPPAPPFLLATHRSFEPPCTPFTLPYLQAVCNSEFSLSAAVSTHRTSAASVPPCHQHPAIRALHAAPAFHLQYLQMALNDSTLVACAPYMDASGLPNPEVVSPSPGHPPTQATYSRAQNHPSTHHTSPLRPSLLPKFLQTAPNFLYAASEDGMSAH